MVYDGIRKDMKEIENLTHRLQIRKRSKKNKLHPGIFTMSISRNVHGNTTHLLFSNLKRLHNFFYCILFIFLLSFIMFLRQEAGRDSWAIYCLNRIFT